MAQYIVFNKNQLEGEYDDWQRPPSSDAFLRVVMKSLTTVNWYKSTSWGLWQPIEAEQVPSTIKAMCLLMNLPI